MPQVAESDRFATGIRRKVDPDDVFGRLGDCGCMPVRQCSAADYRVGNGAFGYGPEDGLVDADGGAHSADTAHETTEHVGLAGATRH